MSSTKFNFLYYNAGTGSPDGWADTLSVLRDDNDEASEMALIRHLSGFAAEFSLKGNVWQSWLTYVLMMHENAFTLACERNDVDRNATMFKLASADFSLFRELFAADLSGFRLLSAMSDYQPLVNSGKQNRVGQAIETLRAKLAEANSAELFEELVSDTYRAYGVGIFGLYRAFRVCEHDKEISIVPVTDDTDVTFDDLIGLETQKKTLRENTEAFLIGKRANNVLLYGDSGTGKSTSIHALMHDYFSQGLRLIELTKQDRSFLPQVLASIKKRNYHFIIFLDDLSFEENESDYKELKAMLEGALEKRSDRVLIYATSNRRHLIRETWSDRNDMEYENDIHHSDTMEEKLSLASRFGVTIYYGKPDQKEYLKIVQELARINGIELDMKELNDRARKWELRHGGMSGRTASQLISWLMGETESDK